MFFFTGGQNMETARKLYRPYRKIIRNLHKCRSLIFESSPIVMFVVFARARNKDRRALLVFFLQPPSLHATQTTRSTRQRPLSDRLIPLLFHLLSGGWHTAPMHITAPFWNGIWSRKQWFSEFHMRIHRTLLY